MSEEKKQQPPQAEGQEKISNEELRARLEDELRKVKVADVLVQTAVTLVNIGFLKLGLTESTKGDRDLAEAERAIESLRALAPVAEKVSPELVGGVREALAQMQMEYAKLADGGGTNGKSTAAADQKQEAPEGPPQEEGSKLWTPPGT